MYSSHFGGGKALQQTEITYYIYIYHKTMQKFRTGYVECALVIEFIDSSLAIIGILVRNKCNTTSTNISLFHVIQYEYDISIDLFLSTEAVAIFKVCQYSMVEPTGYSYSAKQP